MCSLAHTPSRAATGCPQRRLWLRHLCHKPQMWACSHHMLRTPARPAPAPALAPAAGWTQGLQSWRAPQLGLLQHSCCQAAEPLTRRVIAAAQRLIAGAPNMHAADAGVCCIASAVPDVVRYNIRRAWRRWAAVEMTFRPAQPNVCRSTVSDHLHGADLNVQAVQFMVLTARVQHLTVGACRDAF